MVEVGKRLSNLATRYNMQIETCSELIDLSSVGISHARCIDDRLISELLNQKIKVLKDSNQRDICRCIASIDIGAYNTFLIGDIEPDDVIVDRKMESYTTKQMNIFNCLYNIL